MLLILASLTAVAAAATGSAQPPGYYSTVDDSSVSALRATLHAIIDDHQRFPYTSSQTDTWDILERADQDPTDATRIVDVNRNASYPKQGGGNSFYDRDHIWPKSYGFPNDGNNVYPYTDCHALFLSTTSYNGSRGSRLYDNCSGNCTEQPTVFYNGSGGGSGSYPGNSNWQAGSSTQGTWEQWSGRRGDVARALFYMAIRYEGGRHGRTGATEPDLILTDDQALINSTRTGNNEPLAYYGRLSALLVWHRQDPVDAAERARNDAVYAYQGNRNPFIDNPLWADCLFGNQIPASEIVRAGNPANPIVFATASQSPVIGAIWDPIIDHSTFLPGAITDVMLLSVAATNTQTPFGTSLCDLSTAAIVTTAPGSPFQLPIPWSCRLVGQPLYTQGASATGNSVRLTNAIDVTIGLQ